MLEKDYVLGYITKHLQKGRSVDDLANELGVDKEFLVHIEKVLSTGEKLEYHLNGLEVVRMYEAGFTFSEIAWVRGITKEAIRLIVDRMIGDKKAEAKVRSKNARSSMRDLILYNDLVVGIEKDGYDVTLQNSGYTEAVFKRLVRESKNWKCRQEENVPVSGDSA